MCGGPNQPRSAVEPTTGRGLIIYIYLIIYIDISRSLRATRVGSDIKVAPSKDGSGSVGSDSVFFFCAMPKYY